MRIYNILKTSADRNLKEQQQNNNSPSFFWVIYVLKDISTTGDPKFVQFNRYSAEFRKIFLFSKKKK